MKERTLADALAKFNDAEAAAAPVLDVGQLAADEHVAARGSLTKVDGILMQALVAQLSRTPGQVRWAGREKGADNDAIPDVKSNWMTD